MLTGNRTPPAWDPLGVAPFAWDLPDPTPVPEPSTGQPRHSPRSVLSRVFVGVALLAGALAAGGVIAGWWALSWAEVSAIALTVVGVGLIIAALRGRGRSLIGPGIFLALLTLGLTVTGVNGTQNYGDKVWTPTSVTEIDNQTFNWNAGGGKLDLSGLVIPANTTATTTLDVRAGQATVVVPANVTVHATCSANVGQVNCLTVSDDGMRPSVTATQLPAAGTTSGGTLDLTVRVGAGDVTVRHD
jgi:predicted membrane protein